MLRHFLMSCWPNPQEKENNRRSLAIESLDTYLKERVRKKETKIINSIAREI